MTATTANTGTIKTALDMIDRLGDIQMHVYALEELTDQLSEIHGANKDVNLFVALDVARKATFSQLQCLIETVEQEIRNGAAEA